MSTCDVFQIKIQSLDDEGIQMAKIEKQTHLEEAERARSQMAADRMATSDKLFVFPISPTLNILAKAGLPTIFEKAYNSILQLIPRLLHLPNMNIANNLRHISKRKRTPKKISIALRKIILAIHIHRRF